MKKWFCIIAVFVIVLSGGKSNTFCLSDYFDGNYFCYTNCPVAEQSINLGPFYETANLSSPDKIGESIVVENFEPIAALKALNANLVSTEVVGQAVVMYAYSPLIKEYKIVGNKKVNLQIATYDDYSVVGWPLILGSF